jgi:RNA polymerase sigma-70 factor (ECF subfamily)
MQPQPAMVPISLPTSPDDDDQLVALARSGDGPSREELFRRHFTLAYRVAYRLLGNEQDALDAVQDGYLKAVRHLGDFDGRSGFRTWLLRVVSNAALDLGRRKRRRPTVALDEGLADAIVSSGTDDDAARRLHAEDIRRSVNHALELLSPPIRATFVLFAEAGLSYKEIAEAQGVPVGTVMSRLHFARQKLQAQLGSIDDAAG